MYKIIVFDMAGTTVDEQNVVYQTVHNAIARANFPVTLELVLEYAAGKEKFQAICDVLEQINDGINMSTAKSIYRDFEQLLQQAYADLTPRPMPGALETFAQLREKGIHVVLNTGYQRGVAEGLLNKLGWEAGREFDLLVTASDVANGRPAPDMIEAAMLYFDITDPSEVGKIGDSATDIEEGIAAGCGFSAGITTGAQSPVQLAKANPTHIFNSLAEVLTLV